MPEANALMGVTAVVVAGLVVWVAIVLLTAKEPWARALVAVAPGGAPGVEGGSAEGAGSRATELEGDVLEAKAEPVVSESEKTKSEDSAS